MSKLAVMRLALVSVGCLPRLSVCTNAYLDDLVTQCS